MPTGVMGEDGLEDNLGAAVGPIERIPLHEAVVGRLRDMIIEGQLAPGARLHESQLGETLGVSRTPLREAIKFLASEGLVELVPRRGAVVKRFSRKNVADMLIVLGVLETLAARLACANATEAGIAEVRRLHDEMMAHYRARRRLPYYKLNQDIHTAIARLSDNEPLAYMHGVLQSRMKRIRFLGNERPEYWAQAVAEHEEMIAALEAREADRLAAVIEQHLSRTWNRVEDVI